MANSPFLHIILDLNPKSHIYQLKAGVSPMQPLLSSDDFDPC